MVVILLLLPQPFYYQLLPITLRPGRIAVVVPVLDVHFSVVLTPAHQQVPFIDIQLYPFLFEYRACCSYSPISFFILSFAFLLE